ncbi:MAG: ornithine cyclodeaminase family protein [Alphaproteobacteria bacterium]|nr:ornithine cyclodeaminase family protein [Alphaproteobacteria bacterium]
MTTLLLTGTEVAQLLLMADCIAAVECGFLALAEGRAPAPGVLGTHVEGGGFHIKAAVLDGCYAAKINGNFPSNPARSGLPTIQGVVVLADARDGRPLAIMDSIELTARRTGAATALAARHLARADARVVAIVGCGRQAMSQIEALKAVRPLARVQAFDRDAARAQRFAADASALGLDAAVAGDIRQALAGADMCVTCTPSHQPILTAGDVPPGIFIAAVGADNPEKNELAPDLMASARVVVDLLDQCAAIGDLRHAILAGAMTPSQIHAELADLLTGRKSGRRSGDEITIFDSTGTAIQDVAAAALVHKRARAAGIGLEIALAS